MPGRERGTLNPQVAPSSMLKPWSICVPAQLPPGALVARIVPRSTVSCTGVASVRMPPPLWAPFPEKVE